MLAAVILCSCGSKQPTEINIAKNEVDITGNAFQSFRLGGDVKLLMIPDPDNSSKWMIRATTPLQKNAGITVNNLMVEMNLLDGNGTKIREDFSLTANDMASLIPVFNANQDVEKTVVFSASEGMKKDFSFKEASELITKVKKIALTINNIPKNNRAVAKAEEAEIQEEEEQQQESEVQEEQNENKPLTLNDLLTKHGIYGMLAQYERLLKNGEKRKAKQVEDRMYAIEKKVKKDPTIPKHLRENFVNYIEKKEDEIERRHR